MSVTWPGSWPQRKLSSPSSSIFAELRHLREYSSHAARRATTTTTTATLFTRTLLCTLALWLLLTLSSKLSPPLLPDLDSDNPHHDSMASSALRGLKTVVKGQKMMEGGGVPVYRTIGTSAMRNLDPFLMLDEFKSPSRDAEMGFPNHPHRGFETCTIMLRGSVEHGDHGGNSGVIGPGGVQWMTAGRGIVHSEFPKSKGDEMLHGFQLWINLPKKDKMCKPRYQDYQGDRIPIFQGDGYSVRVISGEHSGVSGPVTLRIPGFLFDVRLEGSGSKKFSHDFPADWNSFAYVYETEGEGALAGRDPVPRAAHVLANDGTTLEASTEGTLKFLLFAGKPIDEPIVQYGPFVMNTDEEIQQAFMDYQSGRLQSSDVEMIT